MISRARLGIAAVLALACTAPAAAQVPGATYTGAVGDATLRFKVGADGTRVTSYRVNDLSGDRCTFVGIANEGDWAGAPITGGAFEYHPDSTTRFRGRFDGPQSATGTLRFLRPEVPGERPACDTGTLTWTATTTALLPPPGSAPPPGATGPARKSEVRTGITLRRTRTKLAGKVSSADKGCRGRRVVVLTRGSKSIARARSHANGTFSFRRSASTRGRRVRASARQRTDAKAICSAGRSKQVRG